MPWPCSLCVFIRSCEKEETLKISETELAQLRKCGAAECEYKVPNGIMDITQIIGVLNNHILASHPVVQKPAGGGSVKLNATLPILEEGISETQYQA